MVHDVMASIWAVKNNATINTGCQEKTLLFHEGLPKNPVWLPELPFEAHLLTIPIDTAQNRNATAAAAYFPLIAMRLLRLDTVPYKYKYTTSKPISNRIPPPIAKARPAALDGDDSYNAWLEEEEIELLDGKYEGLATGWHVGSPAMTDGEMDGLKEGENDEGLSTNVVGRKTYYYIH